MRRRARRRAARTDSPLLFLLGVSGTLLGVALVTDGSGPLALIAIGLMAAGSLALSAFIVFRVSGRG